MSQNKKHQNKNDKENIGTATGSVAEPVCFLPAPAPAQ